jgi:hypothetical protein
MPTIFKIKPYKVVPFPDGTMFKRNEITIEDPIYDPSDRNESYDHTGDYAITSSSYSDEKHMPFHAFNGGKSGSWKTNFKNNTFVFKKKKSGNVKSYCQDPYFVIPNLKVDSNPNNDLIQTVPSAYQGGGSPETFYTTMVGNIAYRGEWIQIQVPTTSPIYLFRYSIFTPSRDDEKCTFPKSFVLLGSKNGNSWDYIDFQTIPLSKVSEYTGLSSPKVYNLNTTDYYFFFRFVIIELFPGNGVLEISQINLFTFLEHTPNATAVEEGFTNKNNTILNYSNFHISNHISEIFPAISNVPIEEDMFKRNDEDLQRNIYIGLFFTFLASSFFYYNLTRK